MICQNRCSQLSEIVSCNGNFARDGVCLCENANQHEWQSTVILRRTCERFRPVIEKRKKTEAMTKRVKMPRRSDNVFLDLGFPEVEARNLLLRMQIGICIEKFVKRSGLTKARAAARLGLTQPELNALLTAKIGMFSLDALVDTATRAGLRVKLHVTPAKRAAGRVAATA